jgi:hypothetical protein
VQSSPHNWANAKPQCTTRLPSSCPPAGTQHKVGAVARWCQFTVNPPPKREDNTPWIAPAAGSNPSLEGQTNNTTRPRTKRMSPGAVAHVQRQRGRSEPAPPGQAKGAQPPRPGMKRSPSRSKGARGRGRPPHQQQPPKQSEMLLSHPSGSALSCPPLATGAASWGRRGIPLGPAARGSSTTQTRRGHPLRRKGRWRWDCLL